MKAVYELVYLIAPVCGVDEIIPAVSVLNTMAENDHDYRKASDDIGFNISFYVF